MLLKYYFLFLCEKENMITIYHNPRCTKSREGLCLLEELNEEFIIRKYLEEPFSKTELKDVIKKLNIKPIELVRTKEKIWIDQFKNKELSDDELITILIENPKLIERPIIVKGNKAVIARPKEKIQEILIGKNAQTATIAHFIELTENCEQARYAPSSSVAMQHDYDKAVLVITELEKQIG